MVYERGGEVGKSGSRRKEDGGRRAEGAEGYRGNGGRTRCDIPYRERCTRVAGVVRRGSRMRHYRVHKACRTGYAYFTRVFLASERASGSSGGSERRRAGETNSLANYRDTMLARVKGYAHAARNDVTPV